MSASPPCCRTKVRADHEASASTSRWRRGGESAAWILSATTLALLPKCPACVAAYVALATGIGITLPAATCLRAVLVILCVGSLVVMTATRLRSFIARGAAQHSRH